MNIPGIRRYVERVLATADITIDGDRPWDPQVHDERVFARAAALGTLGLGEAFMDGWWSCDALDELVARLSATGTLGRFRSPLNMLRRAAARVVNLQAGERAWQVGRRHYDIGNDLYEAMLDPRLMYSCGYWANADSLADAQTDKLALIAGKLELEPGMSVLDIGCGWGGAAEYFAREHGCSVVGVTVSREQAELARARTESLPVEIRLIDYRDLDQRFDRIVSIGMFEHVGYRNYETFMQVARRCLADRDSTMLLHTIGSRHSTGTTDPWIAKYIFANSHLPSVAQIGSAIEDHLVLEDWHTFGPDYDRTLLAWHANINAAWERLPAEYDDRFQRMWNFYLLASAGSFRGRANQLWQLVLSRDGVTGSYRPRRIR